MTLRQVAKRYDQLRRRYFMGAEPPLRVPPPAADLQFYWLSERSDNHALTDLDEDRDAARIGVDPWFLKAKKYLDVALLHELTHIRNPALSCGANHYLPVGWRHEMARLASLGAPLL